MLQVYRIEVAQSHTTPEHDIFTLLSLQSRIDECENTAKFITLVSVIAIVLSQHEAFSHAYGKSINTTSS